jgi:hypothetical protein
VGAEHIWDADEIKGLKYWCKIAAVIGSAIALKGPSMTEEIRD